jgi:hypothetical protein
MTCNTVPGSPPCGWCGGRGWKLITVRRFMASGGNPDERGMLRRRRTQCLGCAGTGVAWAAGQVS